jgi:hypothetical protein
MVFETDVPEGRLPSLNDETTTFNSSGVLSTPFNATSPRSKLLNAQDSAIALKSFANEDDATIDDDTLVLSRHTKFNQLRLSGQVNRRGTQGNDRLRGTNRADKLWGLNGNDVLIGRGKRDQLLGGGGNDRLKGGSGNDLLLGSRGRDRLIGGGSRDILDGGKGKDIHIGGRGKDTIVTRSGDGHSKIQKADVVKRFQNGRDRIELENITVDSLNIQQGQGRRSNDTVIQHQGTGEYLLVLQDIDHTTITSDDFVVRLTNPRLEGVSSFVNSGVRFSSSRPSEAEASSYGGSTITVGSRTFYIGYRQVSSINQNPILVSFDSQNSNNDWVRTDYEITGADSRGYGLFWSGRDLYAVFSIDGAQGSASEDFRRASQDASQSWLRSYGSGGGAKISVLARIDPATGALLDAVHLSALLSNGNSNSLVVDDIGLNSNGNLVVQAQSWFSPRNPNGSRMTQVDSGSSPFNYTLEITPDLTQVVSTSADGWR